MKVVIIKYNAGNVQSVVFALERLGIESILSDDPEIIKSADKVLFPGVGEASTTMSFLRGKKLDKLIPSLTQPVLGICLGMQLFCKSSEEGQTECLGIIPETTKRFVPSSSRDKVPHMGWNSVEFRESWLPQELQKELVYYVHSYYVPVNEFTSASTNYILPFSAAVQKNNFYGVQFHPEKSSKAGERVLQKFLSL